MADDFSKNDKVGYSAEKFVEDLLVENGCYYLDHENCQFKDRDFKLLHIAENISNAIEQKEMEIKIDGAVPKSQSDLVDTIREDADKCARWQNQDEGVDVAAHRINGDGTVTHYLIDAKSDIENEIDTYGNLPATAWKDEEKENGEIKHVTGWLFKLVTIESKEDAEGEKRIREKIANAEMPYIIYVSADKNKNWDRMRIVPIEYLWEFVKGRFIERRIAPIKRKPTFEKRGRVTVKVTEHMYLINRAELEKEFGYLDIIKADNGKFPPLEDWDAKYVGNPAAKFRFGKTEHFPEEYRALAEEHRRECMERRRIEGGKIFAN